MIKINTPTVSISATTSSARSAYSNGSYAEVLIYNTGTVPVFVQSGDSTVAATTSSTVVPAGTNAIYLRNPNDTHLAAITASGTATVYFNAA